MFAYILGIKEEREGEGERGVEEGRNEVLRGRGGGGGGGRGGW